MAFLKVWYKNGQQDNWGVLVVDRLFAQKIIVRDLKVQKESNGSLLMVPNSVHFQKQIITFTLDVCRNLMNNSWYFYQKVQAEFTSARLCSWNKKNVFSYKQKCCTYTYSKVTTARIQQTIIFNDHELRLWQYQPNNDLTMFRQNTFIGNKTF